MKKSSNKSNLQVSLLCATTILLIFSCADAEKRKVQSVESKPYYPPPVTVLLDTVPPPKRVELKNVSPPRTIQVPKLTGGTYNISSEGKEEKVELRVPDVTRASMPIANFTNFNTEQGLALNGVLCGLQDKSGNLWFGTNGGGVSRYDGTGFTNFSVKQGLAHVTVTFMIEDKNGNLWFATQGGGVSRYDGIRFTTFTTSDGLPDNIVLSILEDSKGNLLFGTNGGGVSRYDGNRFVTFNSNIGLLSKPINAITEDKKGNLWFGTYGGGVVRYTPTKGGTSFTVFTSKQGLASNYIWCITEDSKGNLWFGTGEGGVSRYDGTGFITFSTKQGLANNTVYSILEDKTKNLWFGTQGGLTRYDGINFTSFTTKQGLAGNNVNNITEDKNGNLWLGTEGGGISRYNGNSFNMFTSDQGLAKNSVFKITEDDSGNLWFAPYGNGVCRYDGAYLTTFMTNQGLAHNTVLSIETDIRGNIWFGTYEGGVSRYDGTGFTTFTTAQGLGENTIWDIKEDKRGNLWFGTQDGGVSCYNGTGFTTYTMKQGLPNNTVKSIIEDEGGNLWFGTEGGGVSRYDGRSFTNFTVQQGLAHNSIVSSLKDKSGNLWFGTEGSGVSRYDGSGFISLTTRDGLADDNIYDIVEDKDGIIWMGTNEGFSGLKFNTAVPGIENNVIKGAGLFNESNKKLTSYEPVWNIYNNKTGYPVKDLNLGAMCITRLGLPFGNKNDVGLIWGGCGDQKIIRFDPKILFENTLPPTVFIQSAKIDESNINWYSLGQINKDSMVIAQQEAMVYGKASPTKFRDSLQSKFGDIQFDSITPFYQLPINLVLPYKHNHVSFDFGAIETSRNFMVRYQYMLKGYDKEWNAVTEKSSASFGNIKEGSYTFKLKARSPEGIWSDPINYSFKVLPPWWRTWWMYVTYIIMFLAVLAAFIRWRERSLRKEKDQLERKVETRTHELNEEKNRSENLLLNILPAETAEELKRTGVALAKDFNEVTVLFTDFKNFTKMTEELNARELVSEINYCYSAFDDIISKYGVEKIKTIGDSYMCAGGLPVENKTNPQDTLMAALEIRDFIVREKQKREALGKSFFEIRIGLHTGPVVAGIVGIKKFAYDIWGDTVNIASRMESSSESGKVNISGSTYELVKEKFKCTYRGKIEAKNKGEIDMYFVEA